MVPDGCVGALFDPDPEPGADEGPDGSIRASCAQSNRQDAKNAKITQSIASLARAPSDLLREICLGAMR